MYITFPFLLQAYKQKFLESWQKQKLDALIGPALPFPAVTSGSEVYLTGMRIIIV
jgi:hypothetical protein